MYICKIRWLDTVHPWELTRCHLQTGSLQGGGFLVLRRYVLQLVTACLSPRQGLTCLSLLGETIFTYVGYAFHIATSSGLSRNLWTIHPERSLIVLRWQDCTAPELAACGSDLSVTKAESTVNLVYPGDFTWSLRSYHSSTPSPTIPTIIGTKEMIPTKVAEEEMVHSFAEETHCLPRAGAQGSRMDIEFCGCCYDHSKTMPPCILATSCFAQFGKFGSHTFWSLTSTRPVPQSFFLCPHPSPHHHEIEASAGVGGVFHCNAVETCCGTSRPCKASSDTKCPKNELHTVKVGERVFSISGSPMVKDAPAIL